ncbi:hypothetical protein PVAP13_9NG791800 [Panicum virgatum]|nr:hypothetical protein PVAP13_9NG791800 [Panicum virgatum]
MSQGSAGGGVLRCGGGRDGGGRHGRGCGGRADGVGGDGGPHPAHPCRHRQLHSPGVGDAGCRPRAVQGPRRRFACRSSAGINA